MTAAPIKHIVIRGGGTVGRMAATAFAKMLGRDYSYRIPKQRNRCPV